MRVAVDSLDTTEPSTSAAPRRFSPTSDAAGTRVPVLYAGDSLACALGESVFHDLPDDPAEPAQVFRADLLALRAGFFTVERELTLLDLTEGALVGLGMARSDIVDTPPSDYPVTATWAQAAWDTTTCAGLAWNSRRSAHRLAYLLFVDPNRASDVLQAVDRRRDLVIHHPPMPLWDGDGLGAVLSDRPERDGRLLILLAPSIHREGRTALSLAATSSAICTALSAAPLRRLSLLTNSASPRPPSTPGS